MPIFANGQIGPALTIERLSPQALFEQIYDGLRQRIASGVIPEGARLPATRPLAIELGVSRATVVAAYEQLQAEGYVAGRGGAGYFVNQMTDVELDSDRANSGAADAPFESAIVRREAVTFESKALTSREPANFKPALFKPGVPDPRLFPFQKWGRYLARSARNEPEALVFGHDAFGDLLLREAISAHLAEWRGVRATARQIIVTAGSIDALEICIRTLVSRTEAVAMEDPGYPLLRQFIESLGLACRWLPIDAQGAAVPASQGQGVARLAVVTPSHQFPLGGAMSPARRAEFLAWAEESGGYIIEDDYDSEFRYAGRPIPAMASSDPGGQVIYVGSFSKVLSANLRLGFVVVPDALIEKFATTLVGLGTKASLAVQRPLARFISDGEFYRHIRRVRRIYSDRRKFLILQLRQSLGAGAAISDHNAGMHLTVHLPEVVDDVGLVEQAQVRGLFPGALSAYFSGFEPGCGVILGFCTLDSARAASAIDELSGLVRLRA